MKQRWPFQVSYVYDISVIRSVASSECDAHMFSAELASYYILHSLQDREDILKTSTFSFVIHTRPHSLFAPVSTLSDNVTSIVHPLNKLKPNALKKYFRHFIYLITDICLFVQWCIMMSLSEFV